MNAYTLVALTLFVVGLSMMTFAAYGRSYDADRVDAWCLGNDRRSVYDLLLDGDDATVLRVIDDCPVKVQRQRQAYGPSPSVFARLQGKLELASVLASMEASAPYF